MLAAASQKGQAAASDQPEFTKIDIRVGEITKVRCWNCVHAYRMVDKKGPCCLTLTRYCSLYALIGLEPSRGRQALLRGD